MSDLSAMDSPMLRPVALTSMRKDGRPYDRFSDVEAEITKVLQDPDPAAALRRSLLTLKSQTLVYFARHLSNDRHLTGLLVEQIMRHAATIVADNCKGFDPTDVDEIAGEVRVNLVQLLFSETPSRQSDNLEVNFFGAVQQPTLKLHRKYKDAPGWKQVVTASKTRDGRDPLDHVVDKDSDDALAELIRKTSPLQFRQLLKAIKNKKHRKALILRKLREWPMKSLDPTKQTVTRYFGLRPEQARNVQYWIDQAIKEMRKAFGELP